MVTTEEAVTAAMGGTSYCCSLSELKGVEAAAAAADAEVGDVVVVEVGLVEGANATEVEAAGTGAATGATEAAAEGAAVRVTLETLSCAP
jgi:hypothetical protein